MAPSITSKTTISPINQGISKKPEEVNAPVEAGSIVLVPLCTVSQKKDETPEVADAGSIVLVPLCTIA